MASPDFTLLTPDLSLSPLKVATPSVRVWHSLRNGFTSFSVVTLVGKIAIGNPLAKGCVHDFEFFPTSALFMLDKYGSIAYLDVEKRQGKNFR